MQSYTKIVCLWFLFARLSAKYSLNSCKITSATYLDGAQCVVCVQGGFSMFIQLMPIVVLILVSILSQLMVSTPPYSLYSRPYVHTHTYTHTLIHCLSSGQESHLLSIELEKSQFTSHVHFFYHQLDLSNWIGDMISDWLHVQVAGGIENLTNHVKNIHFLLFCNIIHHMKCWHKYWLLVA